MDKYFFFLFFFTIYVLLRYVGLMKEVESFQLERPCSRAATQMQLLLFVGSERLEQSSSPDLRMVV